MNTKDTIYEIYKELMNIPTVSGFERKNAEKTAEAASRYLGVPASLAEITPHGSVIFRHGSGKGVLVDAHIDTIGMVVREILPGGFLKVANCGGIDVRILPCLEVEIFGKETLRGVFCSTPPHLKKDGDSASDISEMYIDTGLSEDDVCEKVSVGDPVGYLRRSDRLLGDVVSGVYLDDKLCAAAAIYGLSALGDDVPYTLVLSSGEESNGSGAAYASRENAPAALVLDVNFARGKDVDAFVSAPVGEGISISYSAGTSRRFTYFVEECAKNSEIPYSLIIETHDTGTDATRLGAYSLGTPCAVASVPISYMHTPTETASLSDASELARLVAAVAAGFKPEDYPERRYVKGGNENA